MTRRLVIASVLTGIVALLSATRVYTGITPYRFKIVEAHRTAASGTVTVSVTEDLFRDINRLQPPFALIARPNLAGASRRMTITVDGRDVCAPDVSSGSSQRVDCVVRDGWNPRGDHTVVLSAGGDWTLDYFELATHHGNWYGFNNLYILPAGATAFTHPTAIWIVFVCAFVFTALLVPAWRPRTRPLRIAVAAVTGLFALLPIVVLLAPIVSPFLLVLSPQTLVRWLAIALAPQLYTIAMRLARTDGPAMALVRAAAIALAVAVIVSMPARERLDHLYHGNYSGFLNIQTARYNAHPVLSVRDDLRRTLLVQDEGGYDGQFMYYAAADPALRALHDRPAEYGAIFDLVPYRYGRIGFPLLARALSLGDWRRMPAAMFWIVIVSIGLLAGVVAWAAERRGLSPMAGALVLFVPGFWTSLQWSLPEPLAALTLVAAIVCLMAKRPIAAGVLFAGSLLVRETGAIVVLAFVAERLLTGRKREAMLIAVLALTPLALWRLYLGWMLYPVSGIRAFLPFSPSGPPLAGILTMWRLIGEGRYAPHVPQFAVSGIAFPLLLFAAIALLATLLVTRPAAPEGAGLIYALSALTLTYDMVWLHVGNAERTTYEIWVMLLVATLGLRDRPRWQRLSAAVFWAGSAIYIVWGAVDAIHIHEMLSEGVRRIVS